MNKYQEALLEVQKLEIILYPVNGIAKVKSYVEDEFPKEVKCLQELVDKSILKPLAENRVDYQMDWNVEVDVSLEEFVAKFTEFLNLNGWCGYC